MEIQASWIPVLYEVSSFSFRVHDLIFALLLALLLVRFGTSGRAGFSVELLNIFLPLVIFILYIGFTLITVYNLFPAHFASSAASYLRLTQYVFLVPIAYLLLDSQAKVNLFIKAFLLLALTSVSIGIVQSVSSLGPSQGASRVGALLGPNTLGLVSGLLCVAAVIQHYKKFSHRLCCPWLFLSMGICGLILCRSLSSVLATLLTVGMYYYLIHTKRDILLICRWVFGMVIAVITLLSFTYFFRPDTLQAFLELRGGSFTHRSIMGMAGIKIFLDHPLIGVGWQASSLPEVVGAPELNYWLHQIFPAADSHLFPEVNPTSVHSLCLQILAELGLTGALLSVLVLFCLIGPIASIIGVLQSNTSTLAFPAGFFVFALLFVVIWWVVAHPLYGGQIETFFFFSFLGALAATYRIGRLTT